MNCRGPRVIQEPEAGVALAVRDGGSVLELNLDPIFLHARDTGHPTVDEARVPVECPVFTGGG